MPELNLEPKDKAQEVIKEYLEKDYIEFNGMKMDCHTE